MFRKAVNKAGKKVGKAAGKVGKKIGKGAKKLFCFSPNTPCASNQGEVVLMKDLKLGDVLVGGIVVDAVMQIRNVEDPHYKIFSKELNDYIYVTGSHYIKDGEKYIEVCDYAGAELTDQIEGVLSCLVTSDHTIPVGEYTFWDWEDNLVPSTPLSPSLPVVFYKNSLPVVFYKNSSHFTNHPKQCLSLKFSISSVIFRKRFAL